MVEGGEENGLTKCTINLKCLLHLDQEIPDFRNLSEGNNQKFTMKIHTQVYSPQPYL